MKVNFKSIKPLSNFSVDITDPDIQKLSDFTQTIKETFGYGEDANVRFIYNGASLADGDVTFTEAKVLESATVIVMGTKKRAEVKAEVTNSSATTSQVTTTSEQTSTPQVVVTPEQSELINHFVQNTMTHPVSLPTSQQQLINEFSRFNLQPIVQTSMPTEKTYTLANVQECMPVIMHYLINDPTWRHLLITSPHMFPMYIADSRMKFVDVLDKILNMHEEIKLARLRGVPFVTEISTTRPVLDASQNVNSSSSASSSNVTEPATSTTQQTGSTLASTNLPEHMTEENINRLLSVADMANIRILMDLGASEYDAKVAYIMCNKDSERAGSLLLSNF